MPALYLRAVGLRLLQRRHAPDRRQRLPGKWPWRRALVPFPPERSGQWMDFPPEYRAIRRVRRAESPVRLLYRTVRDHGKTSFSGRRRINS